MKDKPIRLTRLESKILRENTRTVWRYEKWVTELVVDHQSFPVSDGTYTTKEESKWLRRQLAIALARLVNSKAGEILVKLNP